MKPYTSRTRFSRDALKDRVRPIDWNDAGKLPGVIVFAAALGALPLAYALDALLGIGWLGSAFGALAIAAILAASACTMVRQ
jgi:hypothetical protein